MIWGHRCGNAILALKSSGYAFLSTLSRFMPTSAFCSYILIVGAGPAKNCTEKSAWFFSVFFFDNFKNTENSNRTYIVKLDSSNSKLQIFPICFIRILSIFKVIEKTS